jgi:hypothetical protein
MLLALQGRERESLKRLRKAELTFEACDMTLHAMVLRFHRDLQAQKTAEAWMRAQGIQNPARFAAMHVPVALPRVETPA